MDFGRPEVLVSDNGPQFSSFNFKLFYINQGITHRTSSPLHLAGNGQPERTIGTVKSMMKKCLQESGDWLQGLATIRNTPVAKGLPYPSELLQGRVLQDDHPVQSTRYHIAAYDDDKVRHVLGNRKSRDKYFFDRHAKPEKFLLLPRQQVHIRTAKGDWRVGEIEGIANDRSYWVDSSSNRLRRNRKDIRRTAVN
ncbi:hypothetical protein EB796_005284 [Bugula neritina]|uniref:Integrase catalytic domain-containing protein n=1 Tax=Bugula neritina TaxID=10212 RepID=A0A7J7KFZ7_BUGNE|nr:hypothetical protein EB796_005284 [Bugula neritina]